jgi:hypothetical protein
MDSREKDRISLKEVAKLANAPDSSDGASGERKENSGMIHLSAMATAAETSPESARPERPAGTSRAAALTASSPSYPSRPIVVAVQPEEAKRGGIPTWMALAGGIALGGLVAGVLFETLGAKSAATRAEVMTPVQSAAILATADTKAPTETAPPQDRGDPAKSLPGPANETPAMHRPPAGAIHGTAVRPQTSSQAPSGPALHSGAAEPVGGASAAPAAGGGGDQTLEALMRRAVGTTPGTTAAAGGPSPPTPAADARSGAAGNLPARPAAGAVQGAVGAVLPAARYCVPPGDSVSRATLTFKSDGSVQGVSLTGDAAGQPAEACIRSKLMGARVPPFSSPTFTWTVTVRPAT